MRRRSFAGAALALAIVVSHHPGADADARPRRAPGLAVARGAVVREAPVPAPRSFGVEVRGVSSPLDLVALFALPGERVPIAIDAPAPGTVYDLALAGRGDGNTGHDVPRAAPVGDGPRDAGVITRTGPASWAWTAPARAGHVDLLLTAPGAAARRVRAFTLVPYDGSGAIGAFRVGRYRGPEGAPAGFVRVTRENAAVRVSPHFTLGEFVSKQAGGYPKYVALRERLLVKLEAIVAAVRARGHAGARLTIMSGFRTPWYNAAIGNRTTSSQHLHGTAADVFVDADGDGVMDDLDGDGRSGIGDARALAAIVAAVKRRHGTAFAGGLASYEATASHGPFVHVDVRGRDVRW